MHCGVRSFAFLYLEKRFASRAGKNAVVVFVFHICIYNITISLDTSKFSVNAINKYKIEQMHYITNMLYALDCYIVLNSI